MKTLAILLLAIFLGLPTSAKASPVLKMIAEVSDDTTQKGLPTFSLTILNEDKKNHLLNLGEMLGNGEEMWTNISAILKGENGKEIPVEIGRPIMVGGRVYFLGVPLTAGSSYRLLVKPDSYHIGNLQHPKSGKYEIQFRYKGTQSKFRDSTQMPLCWEGELKSNWLMFVVP